MKRNLILFCILTFVSLHGQVGLKFTHFRPTGQMGAVLKPTIGAEVLSKTFNDDSKFIVRYGLTVGKFQARMDTFPDYGVISGQGTTVTPGFTVIHKYNLLTLTMGLDYTIQLSDKLSLYPGIDLGAIIIAMEYDSHTALISSEGYTGGGTGILCRFRAGIEYKVIENLGVFAESQRNLAFLVETGGMGYNDYGIGVRYNF